MHRCSVLLFALGSFALALTACSQESAGGRGGEAPAKRPNIVLILADDHACQTIGAYGSDFGVTPTIDRLAREGVLFAQSFVGNSLCAPSRATLLTGLHSHANGVLRNQDPLDARHPTFPRLLSEAGYQTVLFGKWHLQTTPKGFEHWEVLRGQGTYFAPEFESRAGLRQESGHVTEVITDKALAWLDGERDEEHPFLLMIHHKAAHRQWMPSPRELAFDLPEPLPEPDSLFDDWSGRAAAARAQYKTLARHFTAIDLKLQPPAGLDAAELSAWNAFYEPRNASILKNPVEGEELVRWKYQRYASDYLRCVLGIDRSVARILDALENHRLTDDTVVIYTSDHGFFVGEHGAFGKNWMYEESLRTPLIVRWPNGARAGHVEERMVQNIDLAPTILDLAGLSAPRTMHGLSLRPLLEGRQPESWRSSIYYRFYGIPGTEAAPAHRGVRTERFKLIHYEATNEWELYDLAADPQEMRSAIDAEVLAPERERLEAELQRLAEGYE